MASGARHVPRPRRSTAQQDAGARACTLPLQYNFQRVICVLFSTGYLCIIFNGLFVFNVRAVGAQHRNAAEGRRMAAAASGLCAI
jgi:hypothetical protein